MNEDYLIREFEQADTGRISRLFQNVFGIFRDKNYWQWKYYDNPAGRTLSAIALFKDEIIGQLGAVPVQFSVNGEDIIAVQEVDNAILEKHRNFMLFLGMASLIKKTVLAANIKFSYGISIEDTSMIAKTFLGKTVIAPIPRLVKVLDVTLFIQQRIPIKVTVRFVSRLLNWAIQKRLSQKFEIPGGMVLKHIDRFDKRFDEFWESIRTSYPIMVKRNTDYLNWKYANHPYMKYKIVCVEQRETRKIMGYIVLGIKQKDHLIGQIVDLITPKITNKLVERCLISYAIKWFYEQKVAVIRCWMFSHCHSCSELMKAGFQPREKKGINLIVQNLSNNNVFISKSFFTNIENWFISIGDSDMD